MDYVTKDDLRAAVEAALRKTGSEMGIHLADQLAAGARSIASLNEWTAKADADYVRVLKELTELKQRVAKLEGK